MAAKGKCQRGHKGCNCTMVCCQVTDARVEEIRASVLAGRGRSMFDNPSADMDRFHGAMCRCGLRRKPGGLAKHSTDDGRCPIHRDRAPEPYVRGAGE